MKFLCERASAECGARREHNRAISQLITCPRVCLFEPTRKKRYRRVIIPAPTVTKNNYASHLQIAQSVLSIMILTLYQ